MKLDNNLDNKLTNNNGNNIISQILKAIKSKNAIRDKFGLRI